MKPEAGQTWVNEKFGDKVYFIGRCANGIMVFQVEGNEIEHGDLDWSGWRLMQPEDTACDECGGSGEIDSGGCTPWMAPINVPCGKCAQPEPQPAEDPDEWVIQDRVPVRPGVDQVCWNEKRFDAKAKFGFIETHSDSQSCGKMHGYRTGGMFLSVRCRRRDLPKVEQLAGCRIVCKASKVDGIICPHDSCDIEDGLREDSKVEQAEQLCPRERTAR